MKIYGFRDFYLNCSERRVVRYGKYLKLTPRTFDVLQFLVVRHGEIVTKDEILGSVWDGSCVEEGNLPVHISKLRRLLGESDSERFIETVSGVGYRFTAPVKLTIGDEWLEVLPPANRTTPNSESYRLYLRGKYFLEKRTADDIRKATACFRESFSVDPLNVLSYVGTVESYLLLYLTNSLSHTDASSRIQPFLDLISEIDQRVDLVQAMFGSVRMYLDWRFDDSAKHLLLALDLNPDCLVARYRYADLLILSGRFAESLAEVQKTLRTDPLSPLTYKRIGRLFWKMERFGTALIYLKEAVELESKDWEALLILGAVLAALGRDSESLLALEESLSIRNDIETLAMIGYVHALFGRTNQSLDIMSEMESKNGVEIIQPTALARIHLALGNTPQAYQFLETAFEIHDPDLIGLKFDPTWKPLRNETKFNALIRRVGLPE